MIELLSELHRIFNRTTEEVRVFMNILSPVISSTQDEHDRLYYHHIYEEEEQRLERLNQLIPKLSRFLDSGQAIPITNQAFIPLLQDINLEKFGLHNFLEHLDLAMYHFKDEERTQLLTSMSEKTKADYLVVKDVLSRINESFAPASTPVSIKESEHHNVTTAAHDHADENHPSAPSTDTTIPASSQFIRKGLSVGSLKSVR